MPDCQSENDGETRGHHDGPNGDRDEEVPGYLLSKLKSARIITATKQSEKFFRKAEHLIEKNKNRFTPW